ncbi:MAG: peptidylprolyl isomerase [Acidobacteria bacterium]|nr:peptidylprolyl isomerase [Acidobacteriota bacterium]MBI3664498.1 peptidylprolyl isomerase [Acidobacteriota bacterium]
MARRTGSGRSSRRCGTPRRGRESCACGRCGLKVPAGNGFGEVCGVFVLTESDPWLDDHHAIFGEVVEGQDVADKISEVARDRSDRPLEAVVLQKVTIERV